MEFRRRAVLVGAWLSLMIMLVAFVSSGCAGSASGTTTTLPAAQTTTSAVTAASASTTTTLGASPTTLAAPTTTTAAAPTTTTAAASAADRQAAEAYFAAMAPAIDRDYQGTQWMEQAMTQWQQTYASNGLPTDRQAWKALSSILQEAITKEQEIIKGYETITPPEAFRTAHATLLENNRDGDTWAEGVVAAIKAGRPTSELLPMLIGGSPGPSNGDVLSEFQDAAGRVGIDLPTKFVNTYTDEPDSSGDFV
jgi:hypothetical protein